MLAHSFYFYLVKTVSSGLWGDVSKIWIMCNLGCCGQGELGCCGQRGYLSSSKEGEEWRHPHLLMESHLYSTTGAFLVPTLC